MGQTAKRVRTLPLLLLGLALLAAAPPPARGAGGRRVVSGRVYFTNNSPPAYKYLFKLYTRDMRRVVARQQPNGRADFEFRNLRPGRYVLTVTGPYVCGLWYEVDLRRQSRTDMTILGDADCGSRRLPPGFERDRRP